MSRIRLAVTALTGTIMAGKANAAGTELLSSSRQDVTSDFMKALIQKADYHGGEFVIRGEGEQWDVSVKKVVASEKSPVPTGEVAQEEEKEDDATTQWRNLAHQFDRHRMSAMGLLKAVVAGQATAEDCAAFLALPPPEPLDVTGTPVGKVLTLEEQLRSDGKGGPAWWFGQPPAGALLFAIPAPADGATAKKDT